MVSALGPETSARQKRCSQRFFFKDLCVHCSFLCVNAQTHSLFSAQSGSNSVFLADTQTGADSI